MMGFQTTSFVVCLCVLTSGVTGDQEFFIAAVEEDWNYMPEGDVTGSDPNWDSSPHIFKKAMYKQFTDATFTKEIPKPKWLGFVGPVLYGEEGEIIRVVFFNNASRVYSMHPHGAIYTKINEGALYGDGFHGNISNHTIDLVEPGCNFTYTWQVDTVSMPSKNDPDCLSWLYHSHVNTVKDTSAGLLGFLVLCKKGTLDPAKISQHYFLYANTVNEMISWYNKDTRKRYPGKSSKCKIPAINGYRYGNLPGLHACQGETITWHMTALGDYSDIHSLQISGHSFESFHRRENTIALSPAQFVTATMTAQKPGKWLMRCNVFDHAQKGMLAFFNVKRCPSRLYPASKKIKTIRWHYIAAEEVMWDYGPTGINGMDGLSLTARLSVSASYFEKSSSSIGGVYKKAMFKAYDDYHFKTNKTQEERPEHHGILGPVIRAEAGDLIEILFKNMASRSYSLHAEGVTFSKKSEGAFYNDDSREQADNQVAPGESYTYYWYIPDSMAPTEDDPQCLTRTYTSGVDPVKDVYSGLIGPLLICKPGTLDKDGNQKHVDKEFIITIMAINENLSWYIKDSILLAGLDEHVSKVGSFRKPNERQSINGLMYGNLRGLETCVGDVVSWHVLSMGTITDVHSLYIHGNSFSLNGNHHNTVGLIPGDRRTLYMVAKNPGEWQLNCQAIRHNLNGEATLYKVAKCSTKTQKPKAPRQGVKRAFYIQAEEVEWDFAPSGRDLINDKELQPIYNLRNFMKVLYRGYTDATFQTRINSTGEEYLGILGPIIRVEVGDTLKIVFRNKGPQPFSIHPQGLIYQTGGEKKKGMRRPDQPLVYPGKMHTYLWKVQNSDGPKKHDPNCINSPYYSDVNLQRDINTGLIGTLVICRPGTLDKQGKRKDVDRDFAIYVTGVDELYSWMLERNVVRCTGGIPEMAENCKAQKYITINGYGYGNMPPPTMPQYSVVDWYLMSMGNENDVHPVHFHGNDFYEYSGNVHTSDVSLLIEGVYRTVTMYAVNAGKWLFHCHVNVHIVAGTEATYLVEKRNKTSFDAFKEKRLRGIFGVPK